MINYHRHRHHSHQLAGALVTSWTWFVVSLMWQCLYVCQSVSVPVFHHVWCCWGCHLASSYKQKPTTSVLSLLLWKAKVFYFPSVLRHCWLGDRKVIRPVKSCVLVCWWWRFDWSFARLTAPVVTATSIILNSKQIIMETSWYQLSQVIMENGR